MKEELLRKIKEKKGIDFIESEYNQFTKEELMITLREYMYAFYVLNEGRDYTIENIIEELEERL